jgi:hypothetical protein
MRDPHELRSLARTCRDLARSALEPEIIDQLRLWAVELADVADEIEREQQSRFDDWGNLRPSRGTRSTSSE